MLLKAIRPINFLFFRKTVTAGELEQLQAVEQDLFREAVKLCLRITGPVQWHYFGFPYNTQPFTLEISLPVSEVVGYYDGMYHFKRTEPFSCISLLHEGERNGIPESYKKLLRFADENEVRLNMMFREVHLNIDFDYPEACVIEIQAGVNHDYLQ